VLNGKRGKEEGSVKGRVDVKESNVMKKRREENRAKQGRGRSIEDEGEQSSPIQSTGKREREKEKNKERDRGIKREREIKRERRNK
jgi:hypothetical protein